MTLEFLSEAQDEFLEAATYYENRKAELGARFRDEVLRVCTNILADPLLWREHEGGYRRVNCPVFPFYVTYFIREERIIVAAVAHGHRKPNYWRERLEYE